MPKADSKAFVMELKKSIEILKEETQRVLTSLEDKRPHNAYVNFGMSYIVYQTMVANELNRLHKLLDGGKKKNG